MEELRLPSQAPSFLSPSSAFPRERRLSASSSMDNCSQISNVSRSKKSKRAASRVSDFDDDTDDVTILSFLQSTRDLVLRVGVMARRLVARRRPRTRPSLVCEGEILEQTNMICRDFVLNKLTAKDLMCRKVSLVPAHWPNSAHVINACYALEHAYPRIYSNVSRKLCMTMTSTKVVCVALNSVLDVLFEGQTTWAKVVSMFTVCGLFAEECAVQGHAEFVSDVVDVVVEFTNSRVLEWLVSNGGWDCFPYPRQEVGVCDSLGRVVVVFCVTAVLVMLLWSVLVAS